MSLAATFAIAQHRPQVEHSHPLSMAAATLANALAKERTGSPLIHLPCLFKLITHHRCPGCGMTRATTLLWQGRLHEAVALNRLSPVVFLLVLALFCLQAFRLVISQRELLGT